MSGVDAGVLSQIDELQMQYIDALDRKDMAAWLGTFSETADAAYVCTTAESVAANRAVALIMDDCRGRLEDRVTFVTRIWRGTYQEYQTRHLVQRVRCTPAGPDQYEVKTNAVIAFTPSDTGTAKLLTSGVYLDQVIVGSTGVKFLSKTFITDTSVLSHYIVYPL